MLSKIKTAKQVEMAAAQEERKKSEEQISMLAHAVKSIPESVCITDTSGNLIFVNNSFSNSYGYTYNEGIGSHISLLLSENTHINILNQILPATLQNGWSGELLSRKKDSSEFPIFFLLQSLETKTVILLLLRWLPLI